MNRWISIAVLSLGLSLGPRSIGPAVVFAADEESQAGSASNAVYEEVEIMRRLLGQRLQSLYPGTAWKTAHLSDYTLNSCTSCHAVNPWFTGRPSGANAKLTDWIDLGHASQGNTGDANQMLMTGITFHPAAQQNWYRPSVAVGSAIEGTYLKGHGIVYSVTLPPAHFPAQPKAATPAPSPQSEWERIRLQVRGDGKESKTPPQEPKRPSLTETVLRVLAENGHHMKQFGENESITVAITFRELSNEAAQSINTGDNFHQRADAADWLGRKVLANAPAPGGPTTGSNPATTLPAETKPLPSTTSDLELLGDLSVKQGRYEEALSAYRKALGLVSTEDTSDASKQLQMKLARAYLAHGNAEAASKALEQYLSLQKKRATTKPPAPKPTPLPDKLVVTVPKRVLDQAGKLSFEDFRKGVTVEVLRFTADSK